MYLCVLALIFNFGMFYQNCRIFLRDIYVCMSDVCLQNAGNLLSCTQFPRIKWQLRSVQ